MDSVPMIAITGQVRSNLLGRDAFQETDTVGITMPITKCNYLIQNIKEIPRVVKRLTTLRQQVDQDQFLLIFQTIFKFIKFHMKNLRDYLMKKLNWKDIHQLMKDIKVKLKEQLN